jgi:aspartate racemase
MSPQKTLGIVGGMGSHASLWLFNRIIQLSKVHNDQDYLEIILHSNSRIPDRTKAILYGGHSPLPELKRSFEILNAEGIDVSVMACMTAYYYYNELAPLYSGKLVHPIEFVLEELEQNPRYKNKYRLGVIGSTGMLRGGVFQKKLEPLGYEIITVDPEEQEKYFMYPIYKENGFKSGVFNEENRELFMEQVNILERKNAEIIIGACSEIPLVIDKYNINPDEMKLPFIDAFDLLARKVVDYCYSLNQKTNCNEVRA